MTTDKSGARSVDLYNRLYPLEDIHIITRAQDASLGDGRTVEAYAAVFDTPQEVMDQYGHYMETIHRSAFNRTVSSGAAKRALCLYNHGRNVVDGKPNAQMQVPLGKPIDIRVEERGLLTVTRYNMDPFTDRVLESIKNGDITAQSFEGGIYRSNPNRPPRFAIGQPLGNVMRMELGLKNYGPTPIPAYDRPMMVAVRSVQEVLEDLAAMAEEQRDELIRALSTTPQDSETATTTPDSGLGAEDSRTSHSGRLKVKARANAMALEIAMMQIGVKDG